MTPDHGGLVRMSIPVFEDVEPLPGCGCEDCARTRLAESAAREADRKSVV